MYLLRYCSDPKWIPVAERLIAAKTKDLITADGLNPLMYLLRYCSDPKWIPVAERLITTKTKDRITADGLNPLMILMCKNRDISWIKIAKSLSTGILLPNWPKNEIKWGTSFRLEYLKWLFIESGIKNIHFILGKHYVTCIDIIESYIDTVSENIVSENTVSEEGIITYDHESVNTY